MHPVYFAKLLEVPAGFLLPLLRSLPSAQDALLAPQVAFLLLEFLEIRYPGPIAQDKWTHSVNSIPSAANKLGEDERLAYHKHGSSPKAPYPPLQTSRH